MLDAATVGGFHVPLLAQVAGATLALVLLVGALEKFRDIGSFQAAMEGYELLPASLLPLAAWLLPAFEALAGLALLPAATRALGAALALAILALVSLGVAINLQRGRSNIDCGCGGVGESVPLGAGLLLRNLGLAALALATFVPAGAGEQGWLAGFVTAVAALFLYGSYHVLNLWLVQQPRLIQLKNSP